MNINNPDTNPPIKAILLDKILWIFNVNNQIKSEEIINEPNIPDFITTPEELSISIFMYFDNFTKIIFKVLFPLILIFIFGTALKLQIDGILVEICQKY